MELDVLITGGIGLVTSIISAWTSWFFARKKYDTEVDHNVIENMKEVLEFYKQLCNDNKVRIEESITRCSTLENELSSAREELSKANSEISSLRRQLMDLTMNICMDLTCKIRQKDLYGVVHQNKISNTDTECPTK